VERLQVPCGRPEFASEMSVAPTCEAPVKFTGGYCSDTSPEHDAKDDDEGGLRGRIAQTNGEKFTCSSIEGRNELLTDTIPSDIESDLLRQKLMILLVSPSFGVLVALVIAVNTLAMIVELYTQHATQSSERIFLYVQLPDVPPSFFVVGEIAFLALFLTEFGARFYVYRWALFREFFTYIDILSLLPSILLILSQAEDCLEVSLTDNIMLHLASLLRISFTRFRLPYRFAPGIHLRVVALCARASVFCMRQASARQRSSKSITDQQLANNVSPLLQVKEP